MALLPAASTATNSSATEGEVKTWLTDLRAFLADLLGTDSAAKTTALVQLGAAFSGYLTKSATYTLVAADRGKLINCTGTWTLNLSAAASLGEGFTAVLVNTGVGAITIDPNLAETIDGGATYTLAAGTSVLLYCTGATWLVYGKSSPSNGEFRSMQVFTASGTWTKPAGCTRVKVTVVGGGGGSGGANDAYSGGGGGGGCCVGVADVSAISSATVTVGAGGSAGSSAPGNGGTGGTSSWVATGFNFSATGGAGSAASNPAGGAGGAGSGGVFHVAGDRGGRALVATGLSLGGIGGASRSSPAQTLATAATAGIAYGGGASGASSTFGVVPGAAGAAGIVIVEEFF